MVNEIRIGDPDVLALKDAADILPTKRGRKISYSTLFRWATRGIGGVRLATIKVGGTRFTSRLALQDFVENLASNRVQPQTGARQQQAVDDAENQLKLWGF